MLRGEAASQNFKNLILDYLLAALQFLAPGEAGDLPPEVRITRLRQEQLSGDLVWPFRETDIPLFIEIPDGSREAFVVLIEEETEPANFDVLRLVEYTIGLVRLFDTTRVIPVVLFVRPGNFPQTLRLGTERTEVLSFQFTPCQLATMQASAYWDSDNIVARMNLVNMAYPPGDRVRVCLRAMEGLALLEPSPDRQRKYARFVQDYARLTPEENVQLRRKAQETQVMMSIYDEAEEIGKQQGKAESILEILKLRGLVATAEQRSRVVACRDADVLSLWLRRALDARSVEEVLSAPSLH